MRNTSSSLIFASFIIAATSVASALFSSGCGDGGSGTAGTAGTAGAGGTGAACFDYSSFDGTMPAVSFKTDVLPIFQRSCGISTSCHGDPTAPNVDRPYLGPNKNMTATDMDITTILGGIVDVPSALSSLKIVSTGKPEESFMMYKLDFELTCDKLDCAAKKACGTSMPQGAMDPLAQTERDTIRRWIAQGAQNN